MKDTDIIAIVIIILVFIAICVVLYVKIKYLIDWFRSDLRALPEKTIILDSPRLLQDGSRLPKITRGVQEFWKNHGSRSKWSIWNGFYRTFPVVSFTPLTPEKMEFGSTVNVSLKGGSSQHYIFGYLIAKMKDSAGEVRVVAIKYFTLEILKPGKSEERVLRLSKGEQDKYFELLDSGVKCNIYLIEDTGRFNRGTWLVPETDIIGYMV